MLNRIVLIGRLVSDPILRYTQNGVAVTTFTLAVDRQFTNSQGKNETDFINVVTWRGLAENCANYLKKGKLAAADGRLQIRSYDNNEGKKVYVSEVVADNVRFLEKADTAQQTQNANTGQTKPDDPFDNDGKPIDLSDDDLPF